LARVQPVTLPQIQDLVRLFVNIPAAARVPPMGGWAASPDLVAVLVDEFLRLRPGLVVECGSGVSTLWLALAARHHGIDTRVVALEHDATFAESTRDTLVRHGVDDIAEVRLAPLKPCSLAGHDSSWYDEAALADLHDVGLLFVDGPPASTGDHARFPAVALLRDRLAQSSSVLLDDMIREDEQEVARQWEGLLPEHARTDLMLDKGAVLFRRK
jgi:hypothetical protein